MTFILLNNQPDAAVCSQFYSTARLLYLFRAFYTPITGSTISTVSTASGTNHSIVSATFFQRGLVPGMSMQQQWEDPDGGKRRYSEKTKWKCHFSLPNTAWTGLEFNPGHPLWQTDE